MILPEHAEVLAQAIQRIDDSPIWKLADGTVGMDRTRPPGERWHVVTMPWSKKILDWWQNPKVQQICVRAGSQTWKTTMFLIALAWSVRHRPVPKLWITAKDDLAKDISQDRIQPTLERSPDLEKLLLENRLDKTTYKIRTKLCTIDIAGAESSTALEQNPYGEIFADECRNYPLGYLQKLKMRQRNYRDAKRALFSTPSFVGDEFDQQCNLGGQDEWLFPCQGCGDMIALVWSAKYSRLPDSLRKGSQMMFPKETSDVWLECHCNHRHMDVAPTRRWILDHGAWEPLNKETAPELRDPVIESAHYPAMLCPNVKWYDLVKGFRSAVANMQAGNVEDLKIFVNESLGESWREGQHIEDSEVVKASYRIEHLGTYSSEWKHIIHTNDVGKRDFWHIVRGWNPGAESRILSAGRLRHWFDIREIAKYFGLVMTGRADGSGGEDEPSGLAEGPCRLVFIDARYQDPQLQEVYREASQMGWTCLMGVDKPYFEVVVDDETKEKKRRLYSDPKYYDSKAGVGGNQSVVGIEFSICTNTIQDILDDLLAGRIGKFEHPEDFAMPAPLDFIQFKNDEYAIHMMNEPKSPYVHKTTGKQMWKRTRTGPNHLRDCELQQIVGGSLCRCIGIPQITNTEEK